MVVHGKKPRLALRDVAKNGVFQVLEGDDRHVGQIFTEVVGEVKKGHADAGDGC